MSQDTSHSFSLDFVAIIDVNGRGGYRSHNSHSSSHNPGGRGIFLSSSVSSCSVGKNVHGDYIVEYRSCYCVDKRGDRSVDGGRHGSRSKDVSPSSSRNI